MHLPDLLTGPSWCPGAIGIVLLVCLGYAILGLWASRAVIAESFEDVYPPLDVKPRVIIHLGRRRGVFVGVRHGHADDPPRSIRELVEPRQHAPTCERVTHPNSLHPCDCGVLPFTSSRRRD